MCKNKEDIYFNEINNCYIILIACVNINCLLLTIYICIDYKKYKYYLLLLSNFIFLPRGIISISCKFLLNFL